MIKSKLKLVDAKVKALAVMVLLIGIIFSGFYLQAYLESQKPEICIVDGVCKHEEKLNELNAMVPYIIGISLALGAIIFYFMSTSLQKKQKSLKRNTKMILNFLSKDEQTIVKKILSEKDNVLQSDISRLEGIGKLKSHRILQKLKDRNIVKIEKFGKTNIVKLNKNIRNGLI